MPFSKRKMTKIDTSDNLSNFNRLLKLLKQLLVCYHFDFCYNKLMKTLNLTGERFGRLTVIKKTDKRAANNEFVYICRCDCGKIIESYTSLLRQGRTRSCGCLHRDTRMKDLSVLNAHKKIIDGVQMDMFENRHNKITRPATREFTNITKVILPEFVLKGFTTEVLPAKLSKKLTKIV